MAFMTLRPSTAFGLQGLSPDFVTLARGCLVLGPRKRHLTTEGFSHQASKAAPTRLCGRAGGQKRRVANPGFPAWGERREHHRVTFREGWTADMVGTWTLRPGASSGRRRHRETGHRLEKGREKALRAL